jgi:hypothetical protein
VSADELLDPTPAKCRHAHDSKSWPSFRSHWFSCARSDQIKAQEHIPSLSLKCKNLFVCWNRRRPWPNLSQPKSWIVPWTDNLTILTSWPTTSRHCCFKCPIIFQLCFLLVSSSIILLMCTGVDLVLARVLGPVRMLGAALHPGPSRGCSPTCSIPIHWLQRVPRSWLELSVNRMALVRVHVSGVVPSFWLPLFWVTSLRCISLASWDELTKF